MIKKRIGRPENTIPNVYDSMAQCAAVMGIPEKLLRVAKREGCDAFRSNRVYVDKFIRWAFSGDRVDDNAVDWNQALAKFKAKREELKLGQEQRLFIARAEIGRRLLNLAKDQKAVLIAALPNDPQVVDDICLRMQSLVSTWKA